MLQANEKTSFGVAAWGWIVSHMPGLPDLIKYGTAIVILLQILLLVRKGLIAIIRDRREPWWKKTDAKMAEQINPGRKKSGEYKR